MKKIVCPYYISTPVTSSCMLGKDVMTCDDCDNVDKKYIEYISNNQVTANSIVKKLSDELKKLTSGDIPVYINGILIDDINISLIKEVDNYSCEITYKGK